MSRQIAVLPEVAVFDCDRVTDGMVRVLAVLGAYANKDGWCWPKLETLAARMRRTKGAVSRMIAKLVEAGYVEMHYEVREGRRRCVYRVLYDRPLETLHEISDGELTHDPDVAAAVPSVVPTATLDENGGAPRVDATSTQSRPRVVPSATVSCPSSATDSCPSSATVLLRSSPIEQPSTTGGEAATRAGVLHVLEQWNAMAVSSGLPTARDTAKRRQLIAARLREPGWRQDFAAALGVIAASPWHRGANDRRWVATLDFLLRPDKATQLAEQAAAARVVRPVAAAAASAPGPLGLTAAACWALCVSAGLTQPMLTRDTVLEICARLGAEGRVSDGGAFAQLVLHLEPWALAEIKFGKAREEQLAARLATWRPLAASTATSRLPDTPPIAALAGVDA